jgi:hypothetical protein
MGYRDMSDMLEEIVCTVQFYLFWCFKTGAESFVKPHFVSWLWVYMQINWLHISHMLEGKLPKSVFGTRTPELLVFKDYIF